jgi:hypothetical protein
MTVLWHQNPAHRRRLEQVEVPTMTRQFPQFRLYQGNSSVSYASQGQLFWGGKLRTNFGTRYNLAAVYPPNWPLGDIWAYVPELLARSTPHKYADGHLCLYSNDHGGGGEGVCRGTTAATVVAWSAAWLNTYEVYQRKGTWCGR